MHISFKWLKKPAISMLGPMNHTTNIDVCKLGQTSNIISRNSTYITGEYIQGKFTVIYKVYENKKEYIERLLQHYFNEQKMHMYVDSGIEFYKKDIITMIDTILKYHKIYHIKLTPYEIDRLERKAAAYNKKRRNMIKLPDNLDTYDNIVKFNALQKVVKSDATKHMDQLDAPHMDQLDAQHMDQLDAQHMDQSNAPHMDQLDAPHMDQLDAPHMDQLDAPHMDQLDVPHMDQSNAPHMDQLDAPHMDQLDAQYMDQPNAPQMNQPDAPHMDQLDAPQMDQPDAPHMDQPDAPHMDQPDAPQMDQLGAQHIGQPDGPQHIKKHNPLHNHIKYNPRPYQLEIIGESIKYYEKNDKGLLILTCGTGKTLISLWIARDLDSKNILIGVPSRILLDQWVHEIKKVFPNKKLLAVKGGIKEHMIKEFLSHDNVVVISTYASSHKILNVTGGLNYSFDMKILDEVHHLTAGNINMSENTKRYVDILKIKSIKQLGLTATIKQLESKTNDKVISNDNIGHFGNIIERRTFLWAIRNKIVCDYCIQIIRANKHELAKLFIEFDIIDKDDQRLFLSAYAGLKSIALRMSHHMLIYTNNQANSIKVIKYIELLILNKYFDIQDLYYSEYNSDQSPKILNDKRNIFTSRQFGIFAVVYMLGEGYDLPLLDSEVFADAMTSIIRIVQSAARAGRKNPNEPDKITKIILPVLDLDDSSDFNKVRNVIYQLGMEDETIEHKIMAYDTDVHKYEKHSDLKQIGEVSIGTYNDKLTEIIKISTIHRSEFGTSYDDAKKINAENNVRNMDDYNKLCAIDVRLPKDPIITYGDKFIGWPDYFGSSYKYYDIEICKQKVTEYILQYPELKTYMPDLAKISRFLCTLDNEFPPPGMWIEYYEKYNIHNLEQIIDFPRKRKIE